jgi:hypothetical protein
MNYRDEVYNLQKTILFTTRSTFDKFLIMVTANEVTCFDDKGGSCGDLADLVDCSDRVFPCVARFCRLDEEAMPIALHLQHTFSTASDDGVISSPCH